MVSFSTLKNLRHAHFGLLQAIYLHPSKPLISLVPITCTTYCFQGQGHCYVTIPIVFPANHKLCLDQVQVGPLWGNIVPTNILVTFIEVPPWSLVSHVHYNGFCQHGPTDDRTTTFSRPASRSKFPGAYLKQGACEVFLLAIKSITVPFYGLHVKLSIKRQQERARTIIATSHRPLSKMLPPAKKTKPINDSLILHFFSFYFITEISQLQNRLPI